MAPKHADKVLFYECKYYMLTNFSAFAVSWRDRLWPTAEHAYQASKFLGSNMRIVGEIHAAHSPYEAKRIAHAHEDRYRLDWNDETKLEMMEEILRAKRDQHALVREMLLKTAGKELVEDSPNDEFWGRGKYWHGQNHLGKIWMKLGAELVNTAGPS